MSRRIVLAGASGYGRSYLRELAELERAGVVELAGVCEISPLDADATAIVGARPVTADLPALLRHTRPDLGIVATPIHLHVPMARQALDAGARLLLEKPPAPTLAGWQELVERAGAIPVQVGFQSLGSAAYAELQAVLDRGELGELRGVGGWGAWSRPDGYYRRAAWAGRRMLGDQPVVDGAITNPFAHAVATALALDGSEVEAIELELLRARDIEADDTSCVRLCTARGTVIVIAVTLCAANESEPVLIVHGSRGCAELHYTQDVLVVNGRAATYGRTSPLVNLIAHVDDSRVPLQAPLRACGPFMGVVEAVRLAPAPRRIAEKYLRRSGSGDETRVHVDGVEDAVRACAERLCTFAELGVPFAEGTGGPP